MPNCPISIQFHGFVLVVLGWSTVANPAVRACGKVHSIGLPFKHRGQEIPISLLFNFLCFIVGTTVCPSCRTIRGWTTMQTFYERTSTKASKEAMAANKLQFINSKSPPSHIKLPESLQPINSLSNDQLNSILMNLDIQVIVLAWLSVNHLTGSDRRCSRYRLSRN